MTLLSTLGSAASWHVLTYGTLLGAQFFQTFIGGPVTFRALPRAQFAHLQQNIFLIYFPLQTALPVIALLTLPGVSSVTELLSTSSPHFYESAVPLLATFVAAATNMLVIGPATVKIIHERKEREAKEGKKHHEAPKSKEMAALNRRFAAMHGVSSLLNLAAFLATVGHGFTLGQKLRF